jgi:phospholipid/cholesterol/gamma-HCH transport system ATP-binding protein
MKKIHTEFSTTELIVTHDLAIARNLANDIAVIHEGKILAVGRWEDLKNSKIEFVRYFLNIGEYYENKNI